MLHFKNLKRFIFLQRKTREKHFQTAKILEFPSESLILGFTTRKGENQQEAYSFSIQNKKFFLNFQKLIFMISNIL